MKRLLFVFSLWISLVTLSLAVPLTESDLTQVKKRNHQEHILYENYLETDDGIASVFGYHFDTYLSENTTFILAIFGAVNGNRGGYGIAAFGLGYNHPFSDDFFWDTRLLVGSGGGGGLDAGGGLMWEIQTGPSYRITDKIFAEIKYGYLDFTSGTFKTPILNFGISFKHGGIFIPME